MDSNIDIKRKIQRINDSESPKLIPIEFLPEVFNSDYFFISYSHKDFKSVYVDLLYLQENKLNVWYDREMAAGSNWEKIAVKYLAPFECKGVIFYVSENALVSDSFIKEVEFAQKFQKPIITIIMPFESDYIFEGNSVKGKTFSASKMISILKENNVNIPEFEEKKVKLEEYFPDNIIYLPISMDPSQKVEQIKTKIKEMPLFEYNESINHLNAEIIKVNDPNITEINISDLNNDYKELGISMAVFSNCKFLKYVDFGENNVCVIREYAFSVCDQLKKINSNATNSVPEIYEGAFLLCEKLEEFNYYLNKTSTGEIQRIPNICILHGKDVFCGCKSLKEINIVDTTEIGNGTFNHCVSLEKVTFYGNVPLKSIGKEAFVSCWKLKEISLPNGLETIGDDAFSCDESLDKVDLPDTLRVIDSSAFTSCTSLKEVILPKNLLYIGIYAFTGCDSLNLNENNGLLYLPSKDNPYFALLKPVNKDIEIADIHKDCQLIAGGAFHSCGHLKKIKMSSNIQSIGEYAFYNCYSLTNVTFNGKPLYFKHLYISKENQLFKNAKKKYKYFPVWPILAFNYLSLIVVIILIIIYGWSVFSIIEVILEVLLTAFGIYVLICNIRLKYNQERLKDLLDITLEGK